MTEDAQMLRDIVLQLQPQSDYAATLHDLAEWLSGEIGRQAALRPESPHSPCVARHEDIARDPCHPAMPFYPWGPLERSEA